MLKKLRLKFVVINMSLITVMLLVIFGLVIHFTAQAQQEQSLQLMRTLAQGPHRPDRPGTQPGQVQLPYFVVEIDGNGEVRATVGGYYDLSDTAFLSQVIASALARPEQTGLLEAYSLRYYRENAPWGQNIVFVDASAEESAVRQLVTICCGIGVLSFGLFLAISFLLAKWAVRPVAQAWDQQRQFVADASHELKTPLSVIMTSAELLASPECTGEDRGRFAENVLTMSRRMRSLVERLLELARVDNGAVRESFRELDLSALVADAVLPFEPVCFEQNLTLHTQAEEGIRVRGSESYLQQVIEVLLDNAIKYSAVPGEIQVRLRRQGSRCVLTVANPGPAISGEDLENIFKRFYRVDKARSGGSYGLGLSIARCIVIEHRGRITAQSRDGINTFTVQLPVIS